MSPPLAVPAARPGKRRGADGVPARGPGLAGRWCLALVAVVIVAAMGACASPEVNAIPLGPDGQPDPQLVAGEALWAQYCTICHGATGRGGNGPKLADGAVATKYPEVSVQTSIVANGVSGRMPPFREKLSSAEIDAVVAYTREVL